MELLAVTLFWFYGPSNTDINCNFAKSLAAMAGSFDLYSGTLDTGDYKNLPLVMGGWGDPWLHASMFTCIAK